MIIFCLDFAYNFNLFTILICLQLYDFPKTFVTDKTTNKKANAISKAMFYHNKAGYVSSSKTSPSNSNVQVQSVLKSSQPRILQKSPQAPTVQVPQVPVEVEQKPPLSHIQMQNDLQTPVQAKIVHAANSSSTSLLKNYRKQKVEVKREMVTGELRPPNIQDKSYFYSAITDCSKCLVCQERVSEIQDIPVKRYNLAMRHAYRKHLSEEMKLLLLKEQLKKNIQNLLKCPECPDVVMDTYAQILEHFSVYHKQVIDSFWQLVHFKTSILTKNLENPNETKMDNDKMNDVEDPNAITDDDAQADLDKFSHENAINSIKEAKKLMKIPMNATRIQPMACFLMSEHLEHCHECWKVRIGQGNIGSICQFEGFRKVKRIPTDLNNPFGFEASGFLDPFRDPFPKDIELWKKPTKEEVDLNDAKMILLRAGDEFCNLAKTELDMIEEHKKKVQDEKGKFCSILTNLSVRFYPKMAGNSNLFASLYFIFTKNGTQTFRKLNLTVHISIEIGGKFEFI